MHGGCEWDEISTNIDAPNRAIPNAPWQERAGQKQAAGIKSGSVETHFYRNRNWTMLSIKLMKHCTYCGKEYPDELETCPTDGHRLQRVGDMQDPESRGPKAEPKAMISSEEKRFWERMTFREFGVFLIRLQAVWFVFYAIYGLTYLPSYFPSLHEIFSSDRLRPIMDFRAFLEILRILLHVAGAVACIQYADRIVSWLVKDLVPNQQPDSADE